MSALPVISGTQTVKIRVTDIRTTPAILFVQPPFSYSYNPQSSSTIGYKHYYFGGAAVPLKYLGEEIRNGPPRPQVESAAAVPQHHCYHHIILHKSHIATYTGPIIQLHMALEPPVEEEYPSLEHAESVVCRHARLRGYALTRVKDKRKPPTVRRRDLRCSKGGVKRGEGVLREDTRPTTKRSFYKAQSVGFRAHSRYSGP